MLASMRTTIEQKRETFGDPLVRMVVARESFDRYRDAQDPRSQADLDAMVTTGMLVVKESSD